MQEDPRLRLGQDSPKIIINPPLTPAAVFLVTTSDLKSEGDTIGNRHLIWVDLVWEHFRMSRRKNIWVSLQDLLPQSMDGW